MRAAAYYLIAVLAALTVVGTAVWYVVGPADRRAVLVSAGLTVAVQMTAFAVARALRDQNLMIGWGLGSILRLVALVLYAVFVARLWRASMTPALLSLVGFLFVTTVFEPVFLKR